MRRFCARYHPADDRNVASDDPRYALLGCRLLFGNVGTWGASGRGPTRCHLGRNRRTGFNMTITTSPSHPASVVSETDQSLRDRQSAEIEQLLRTAAEEVDPRRSQLL